MNSNLLGREWKTKMFNPQQLFKLGVKIQAIRF